MIWLAGLVFAYYICNPFAGIAQLVEHDLAKVGVAGPSPVSRSREEKGVRKDALFFAKVFHSLKSMIRKRFIVSGMILVLGHMQSLLKESVYEIIGERHVAAMP